MGIVLAAVAFFLGLFYNQAFGGDVDAMGLSNLIFVSFGIACFTAVVEQAFAEADAKNGRPPDDWWKMAFRPHGRNFKKLGRYLLVGHVACFAIDSYVAFALVRAARVA
jgi:hypothetical protein